MNTTTHPSCDHHPHARAAFAVDVGGGQSLLCVECQRAAAADADNAGVEYVVLPGTDWRALPDGLYDVEAVPGVAGGHVVVVAGRAVAYERCCECCGQPSPCCDCLGPATLADELRATDK